MIPKTGLAKLSEAEKRATDATRDARRVNLNAAPPILSLSGTASGTTR